MARYADSALGEHLRLPVGFRYTGTDSTAEVISLGGTPGWYTISTAGNCAFKFMVTLSGASGDGANVRLRTRSAGAGSATSLNIGTSAYQNDYGNMFGVQAYAQPLTYTQAGASNIVCGLYSCIQATASSSGRRWSTWIDDHSTTKASGGHYLLRLSDNGSTVKDGAITIYSGGRLAAFVNCEDAVGGGFLTDTSLSLSTQAGALKVTTPAGTRYLALYSS